MRPLGCFSGSISHNLTTDARNVANILLLVSAPTNDFFLTQHICQVSALSISYQNEYDFYSDV